MDYLALIVSSLALLVAALSAWYAREQVKVAKKADEAQNLLALVDHLQREEVREARAHLLGTLSQKDYSAWSDDDKLTASRAAAAYDMAGILICRGLVEQDAVLDNWGPNIVRCYEVCQPLIEEYRGNLPKEIQGKFWNEFEWLAEQALALQLSSRTTKH